MRLSGVVAFLRSISLGFAEIVSPRYCMVCGRHLSAVENMICGLCRAELPATHYHRQPDNPMALRFKGYPAVERATAVFRYARSTPVARAIHDFKYNRYPSLAVELGREMGRRLLTTGYLSDIDIILPVPVHFTKRLRRGYNQSECLARGLAEVTGIFVGHNLYARRPHRTQTGRTLEERRMNTENVFAVKRPEELIGKRVLILDDVCTTGSTFIACADALKKEIPGIKCVLLALAATEDQA